MPKIATVTAYSCDGLKTEAEILMNCPSKLKHPQGRTATGTVPTVGRTVACAASLRGKTVNIQGLGKRVCEDRGGAINEGRIDLYVNDIATAKIWGIKQLPYTIVD